MTPEQFLDTNVLLYSISTDAAEEPKRTRAIELLEHDGIAVSVQVLQEFYVQATRATRRDRLPHHIAAGLIESWLRLPIQEITRGVLMHALAIKSAHGFSYWDSAIIAAARALGCKEIMTEDISHGREIEGILIVNPFR